jgi:hypothetical protein
MTPLRFPHARGVLGICAVALAFVLSGCGDSVEEGLATPTEEHQQATNKMEEFMKNKGKSKKGATPAAPAATPTPAPAE